MDWRRLTAALVVIGGTTLAFYLALTLRVESRPDYGGVYREGIVGIPLGATPLLAPFNDADKDLAALVFNGLVRLSPQGEVLPDLAERWEVSSDGLRYTFYLRPNIRWHDGQPVTAEDVVQTLQLWRDPAYVGSPDEAELWRSVTVRALDPATVEMTLTTPYAPFIRYLTQGILPSSTLRTLNMGGSSPPGLAPFPIGTGPYRFVEATIDRIVLQANPNYHFGAPYITTFELRFYPDEQAAAQALLRGEIDGLLFRPADAGGVQESLPRDGTWNLYTVPRSSYTLLVLNLRDPLFQDKRLRQALLLSLDREALVQEAIGQPAIVAPGPIPPGSWAFNGTIAPYPYDPERARQLLQEAGWQLNANGIWERGGQELSFSLITNDDPLRVREGQAIVRQWRRMGVRVNLSASGTVGLLQDFLAPRRFQAALFGFDVGTDPDAYPFWHSSQRTADGFNFSSYASTKADAIMEQARRTTDDAARRELYGQFQELFLEDLPSLPLYYPVYTYAVSSKVQGLEFGVFFEPSDRFAQVERWYMKTKYVWSQR